MTDTIKQVIERLAEAKALRDSNPRHDRLVQTRHEYQERNGRPAGSGGRPKVIE